MITCRECTELLLEFLTGELDAEHRERIREHLTRCPPCITYIETYKITVQLTRQLAPGELPPDVAERLKAVLKEVQ
jgi:anti-sigma factor RsiW